LGTTTPTRYQSGFFFQHEALLPFDYYWRLEPDVKYTCDIDFDPFLYMQDNNKKYGKRVGYSDTLVLIFGAGSDQISILHRNVFLPRVHTFLEGIRGDNTDTLEYHQRLHDKIPRAFAQRQPPLFYLR